MTESNNRSAGRFLGRLIRAFFVLFFLLVLLGGVAVVALQGTGVLRQSFINVVALTNANEDQIKTLQNEVTALQEGEETLRSRDGEQQTQIDTLITDATSLQTADDQLIEQMAQLEADFEQQAATLLQLNLTLSALMTTTETTAQNTGLIGDGLLALQGEFAENSRYVDELGGEIDTIRSDVVALANTVAATETAVSLANMQTTMQLLYLSAQINQARLYLLTAQLPLASESISQSLSLLDQATIDTAVRATLQTQLITANTALTLVTPQLDLASQNLETAWQTLNTILQEQLIP